MHIYSETNLSKLNLLRTNFCVLNRQAFGKKRKRKKKGKLTDFIHWDVIFSWYRILDYSGFCLYADISVHNDIYNNIVSKSIIDWTL